MLSWHSSRLSGLRLPSLGGPGATFHGGTLMDNSIGVIPIQGPQGPCRSPFLQRWCYPNPDPWIPEPRGGSVVTPRAVSPAPDSTPGCRRHESSSDGSSPRDHRAVTQSTWRICVISSHHARLTVPGRGTRATRTGRPPLNHVVVTVPRHRHTTPHHTIPIQVHTSQICIEPL